MKNTTLNRFNLKKHCSKYKHNMVYYRERKFGFHEDNCSVSPELHIKCQNCDYGKNNKWKKFIKELTYRWKCFLYILQNIMILLIVMGAIYILVYIFVKIFGKL